MKRIRVECGVCKATRFYSIHRGITRIAGVVACEACRQFYQRFKKQPWVLNCNKGGRCFGLDETPKNKCKACWVAHIICRCPVPLSLYNHLVGYLPTDLKSKMAGKPPTAEEVPEKERGGLGLEIYQDNDWVDVTDKAEVESLLRNEEENETDEPNEPDVDIEFEAEEEMVDDPVLPEANAPEVASSSVPKPNRPGPKKGKKTARTATLADEQVMSSAIQHLQISSQLKFMENFNPKTSERVRRKKKKVQYFTSTGRTKNQNQQSIYGPDGALVNSGKDLCDCLQSDCPGCYYPCPKCFSGKCGSECRMNRKWYYEKVEVEGTKLTWTNEFVKKK
ncbi:uncharacterized protein [Procambarus clarkii]|nr:uncharacterized protein LOC123775153 isoform X2 [Procambarus clarkii]XP_045626042.1 uncharacterized protein LOC123775153 isoform X2 [Procambarus clarkii]XP_045626043.1 uncharacterized protein LOC123775153 isoform X2 [Procambarus clarkii]